MRPNTVHAVLTTDHCLTIGGHFYSSTNYHRTLAGHIAECYYGSYITNNSHSYSAILLFKTIAAYNDLCMDQKGWSDALEGKLQRSVTTEANVNRRLAPIEYSLIHDYLASHSH